MSVAAGPEPDGAGDAPGGGFFAQITGLRAGWRSILLVPLLATLSALIIGAVIIALTEGLAAIGAAYGALFRGAFGSMRAISETLTLSSPLILAGLSVALGFRAGLFNIGAKGQMLIGGILALAVGFSISLPVFLHLPLALLAGFVGGAIWGGIPGLLRAKTGAHEVITTIMLNFIALRLVDYLLKTSFFQRAGRTDPISKFIEPSAQLPRLLGWLGDRFRLHGGIILALLAAWFVYWLLFRSTLGFEFRAVGANPDAARYAGMNVTRLYIAVMAVAGGLAGLGGTDQILGVLRRATPNFAGDVGFDAIALALLGRSHPVGVVLAGFLFGALKAGGQAMQASTDVGVDLITVIQALIIVFIAAPALIKAIYRVKTEAKSEQLTRGWAS